MSPLSLLDPLVHVAYVCLTGIAGALPGVSGGAALALSVVLLTVLVRTALLPLTVRRFRAERSRAALAPEITRLRARYAKDPSRLAREITEVHRRAGVSPVAGLGPALLQLPVLSALYRVVVVPSVAGHPNVLVSATLMGSPLSAHWLEVVAASGLVSGPAAALAGLVAALLLVAWLSSRQSARAAASGAPAPEGAMAALMRWLPFATVVFALLAPLVVGLYLLTTTAWTVAERAVLPRFVRLSAG